MNRADLFAIVAGCRAGEKRVMELCERFGKEIYLAGLQALLDRTYEAMRTLIQLAIPEEPQSFEDWIDDDGLGNGPFKMKLTIWREGDHAFFDWSGTDPQALGPINFYLSEGMFKMFIGIYLIMVNDPQILFNDGFYPLLHVVMPEGSLLRPRFPAALGCRTHALARQFDVLGGALVKQAPELNTAAGYGTSPYMLYSGWDGKGEFFYSMEILYGGIPGRPIGDGMDGHSWWPLFENIPTEYLEAYYPLRIDGYTTVTDSGGAGFHRGGNAVEKRYVYLEPGEVSIHDDRWLTRPWGVLGGEPGGRSEKILRRADGTEERLPSKCDNVAVEPGDMLVYRTAGGGGWKDRLDRPVEAVVRDVSFGLVSREKAKAGYGVVLNDDGSADLDATEAERDPPARGARRGAVVRLRPAARGDPRDVRGGDRPRAAGSRHAAALVAARAGRRGARARAVGRRHPGAGGMTVRSRGLPRSGGLRDEAGPDRGRRQRRLHRSRRRRSSATWRTSSRRSRGCSTRPGGAGAPGRLHDRLLRRRRQAHRCRLHRQGACAAHARGGKPLGGDRPADRARSTDEPVLTKLLRVGLLRDGARQPAPAAEGCDSLIVTGASTSGCVRATAVDALQHGYRPVVPREAVGDRNPAAHEANLYDIDAKYGDVVPVDEVVDAPGGARWGTRSLRRSCSRTPTPTTSRRATW